MDNQILQDLQLFGLDESVTQRELQMRWRHLSSHTHPDRFRKDTPEFAGALARQKRLNSAKDRLSAYIARKEAENKESSYLEPSSTTDAHERASFKTNASPHIRTTQVGSADELTLNVSHSTVDALCSVGIFFASLFSGVAVAALASAAFPILAITAPVVLIAVMLVTMAAALLKIKRWCETQAEGGIRDAK